MNSGAKANQGVGRPTVLGLLLAVVAFAALVAGCSDHGPGNLYSPALFGVNLSGANMQLWRVQEFSLSSTAGVGPDQYVMEIKNTGSGGVVGPVTAQVTMASSCGGTTMENYAGTPTASQTVVFGTQGQVINPGETLWGNASDMSGPYQYSVQVYFPPSCSNTADTFSVTMSDPKSDTWKGSFSGTNQ
jgi:hypothetical protein